MEKDINLPLPEYPSPFKYKIEKPGEMWQILLDGKQILAGGETATKDADRVLFDKRPPILTLQNQQVSLEISFRDWKIRSKKHKLLQSNRGFADLYRDRKFQQDLETSLRTYVAPDLKISNGSLMKERKTAEGKEYMVKVGELQDGFVHNFKWTPDSDIISSEELVKNLEEGLKIAQIFLTEAFQVNKLSAPTSTLILSPDQQNLMDADMAERIRRIRDMTPEQERGDLSGIISSNRQSPEQVRKTADAVRKSSEMTDPDAIDTLAKNIIIEEKPNIRFEDIAGQDKAVEEAKGIVEQINHPEDFKKWGIESPRGIIFYGPPGTGKTLIAKALARECEAPFISIDGSEVSSKWYGATERNIAAVFKIARDKSVETGKPAILFIDEVDALARSRKDNDSHEASIRSLAIMLQQIDGLITEEQEGKVVVVCATNRLENVDPAFLSRMTQWIELPLPDQAGRAKIFALQFAARAQRAERELLSEGIDFNRIAEALDGVSGREIADIVEITLRHKANKIRETGEDSLITEEEIMTTIKTSEKSINTRREVRKNQIGFHTQSFPANLTKE